ncbi:MAG: iron-sulfur cluster assembly accessory protein [Ignavibacteria bacterium]|nr:MAG: iron-sulfur cluster assembly accessory protein [Ignavibacteria bacterium]
MAETTTINKPKLKEDITLTPKAAEHILVIKKENKIPDSHSLRIGVKGGGCSGLTYVLGFDAESKQGDMILEIQGITVFIDPKSLFFLSGTELDFQDGLNGKGFVFNNPQATKTCGCGNSFGV